MKRTSWPRVLRKEYVARDFEVNGHQGQMSLIRFRELIAPLTIRYKFADVLIADKDYCWLQIALKEQYFWLTAMFDDKGKLLELYFDITAGNRFDDPENPCFEDMYLDIVIAGDTIEILDQDELDEALQSGDISQQEYDHAEKVCRELFEYLCIHKSKVIDWCNRSYRELKPLLNA